MIISSPRVAALVALYSVLGTSTDGLSVNNKNNVDRRTAIHQAGIAAFGVTACGPLVPNSQLVAHAEIDTINPIATLADGSKFPLASFGLQ